MFLRLAKPAQLSNCIINLNTFKRDYFFSVYKVAIYRTEKDGRCTFPTIPCKPNNMSNLRIMGKCTSRNLFRHGELVHASACVH